MGQLSSSFPFGFQLPWGRQIFKAGGSQVRKDKFRPLCSAGESIFPLACFHLTSLLFTQKNGDNRFTREAAFKKHNQNENPTLLKQNLVTFILSPKKYL